MLVRLKEIDPQLYTFKIDGLLPLVELAICSKRKKSRYSSRRYQYGNLAEMRWLAT